jgi:hypothetical protein
MKRPFSKPTAGCRRSSSRGIPASCGGPPRGADGEWAVIVLWGSAADADTSAGLAKDHPVTKAFDALLDPSTVQRSRYETLD